MTEKKNYFVLIGQIIINLGVICQMAGAKRMGAPHPELAVSAVQANLFGMRVARIANTPEGMAAMEAAFETEAVAEAEEAMIEEAGEQADKLLEESIRRHMTGGSKLH